MAETNKSYDQSRNALTEQINAISSDLAAQKERINAQYNQQSKTLDNQRNWQAQASSMAASNNGGSFGGSSEIANKKYYQQSYVPAVTQLQTNQSNDLSSAESQANSNRLSLQQTLASLNDEASKYALQRYDTAVQAERDEAYRQAQLALQRKQIAAQNAYTNYLKSSSSSSPYSYYTDASGGTQFYNTSSQKGVTMGTYLKSIGATGNSNILAAASQLVPSDYANLERIVNAQGGTKHSNLTTTTKANYQYKNYLSAADNALMKRLGLQI